MTATAEVRFAADGSITVQSYVRLTDSTHIQCCIYPDIAPILTISDSRANITLTNPGMGEVTEDDVRFARELADAATRYATDMQAKLAVVSQDQAAEPADADSACRAA